MVEPRRCVCELAVLGAGADAPSSGFQMAGGREVFDALFSGSEWHPSMALLNRSELEMHLTFF